MTAAVETILLEVGNLRADVYTMHLNQLVIAIRAQQRPIKAQQSLSAKLFTRA